VKTLPGRRRAAQLLLLSLLAGAAAAGCMSPPGRPGVPPGSREFRVPAVDEVLFGTWVASAGGNAGQPVKLRLFAWGLVEGFASPQDGEPRWTGTSFIAGSWVGSGDERWFREFRRWSGEGPPGAAPFVLARVSSDGLTLECISSSEGWPAQADMKPSQHSHAQVDRVGALP